MLDDEVYNSGFIKLFFPSTQTLCCLLPAAELLPDSIIQLLPDSIIQLSPDSIIHPLLLLKFTLQANAQCVYKTSAYFVIVQITNSKVGWFRIVKFSFKLFSNFSL
jgi:hypothetical protein